jgi:hypothetical protein
MIRNGKFVQDRPVRLGCAYIPPVKWRGDADAELIQKAFLRRRQRHSRAGFWRDFAGGMVFWLMMLGPIMAYVLVTP